MDPHPDPGGPKTCGSGSGTPSLAGRTDLCVARRPVERLSASCLAAPRLASMEARFRSRCEGGNSCSCCCWCCCCCCCSPGRKPANSRSCRVTEVSSTRAPEPRALVVVVPEPAARWEELLYRGAVFIRSVPDR
jgi:hypothetical protein